jgi:hypothetical protein
MSFIADLLDSELVWCNSDRGGFRVGARGAEAPPSKLIRCVTYILAKTLALT